MRTHAIHKLPTTPYTNFPTYAHQNTSTETRKKPKSKLTIVHHGPGKDGKRRRTKKVLTRNVDRFVLLEQKEYAEAT